MKKLRVPNGPFERRRAEQREIAQRIQSDPEFAALAAQVWEEVTGGDGVLKLGGKPVTPSLDKGVSKDLK